MTGSTLRLVDLFLQDQKIQWEFVATKTMGFSEMWQARLQNLPRQSALDFAKTHTFFGHYCAELIEQFLHKHQISPDFIAAHGHTIFHAPEHRYTVQIGDGAAMAALTGYPVINNFRAQDIAISGEGAPLAPIADQYLLPGFDFYLNLGGIANISYPGKDRSIAFDIGGANQIFNALAQELDLAYDHEGAIAAKGQLLSDLFQACNANPYFSQAYPKSLDNQWTFQHLVLPFLQYEGATTDKMHTAVQHIAYQIKQSIDQIINQEKLSEKTYRMMVTGGGAYNRFLLECIQNYCPQIEVIIPDELIIEFKEAAMIALMGVLRLENRENTISSVTGAQRNTIGGSIHQGWKKLI